METKTDRYGGNSVVVATSATRPASKPGLCRDNSSGLTSAGLGSRQTEGGVARQELMPAPSLKRPRHVEDWLLHPPDGSGPIDLRQEAEAIYSAFELSLCRDVVFELHRELHTGLLTTERLWAERLAPPPKSVPGGDVYGRIPPREPSSNITCPSCNRSVGAARYAPHLDKCALGSSRGRASRSARSSVPAPDAFRSSGSSNSPSAKQYSSPFSATAKLSAKLLPSPKAKPPKPAPSPKPQKVTSPRPPSSKLPSSLASSSRVPLKPRPAPPPPPPVVHAALTDTGRDPLHILIKLVGGVPVQTYHRVVLSTPRAEKPHSQQPRSPSTRSVGSDDRPSASPRNSSRAAVGGDGSSGGNSTICRGGGGGSGGGTAGASAIPAKPSLSPTVPVPAASEATAVRTNRQRQQGGALSRSTSLSSDGLFSDKRLVDSRGGNYFPLSSSSTATTAGVRAGGGDTGGGGGGRGGGTKPPKRPRTSEGDTGYEGSREVAGHADFEQDDTLTSPPSSPPPPAPRVPPPMFISAPPSPPPSSNQCAPNNSSSSSSSANRQNCGSSGRVEGAAGGKDLDRRYLGMAVDGADRQALSCSD